MSSPTSSSARVRRVPLRLPLWFALSLTVFAALSTWWAIGNQDWKGAPPENRDYMVGPYQVSVTALWIVGAIAGLGVAAGLVWQLVQFAANRSDQGRSSLTLPAVGVLAYVGVVAAWSWRAVTAGVAGANIGGGFLLVGAPIYIVLLLIVAFVVDAEIRKDQLTSLKGTIWLLCSAAVLVLPTVVLTLVFAWVGAP